MDGDGKRVCSKPHRGRRIAAVVGGVLVGVVLTAYLSLCVLAGAGDSLLPNTAISGIPLGGMDREAATLRLEEELKARLSGMDMLFRCGGKVYRVPGSAFTVQAGEAVDAVSARQRGSFLTRGAQYIQTMIEPDGEDVGVTLTQAPREVLMALAQWEDNDADTTWKQVGQEVIFTKGRTGRRVDLPSLLEGLARQAETALNSRTPPSAPVEAGLTESAPREPDLAAIADAVYSPVADAYFDGEARAIIPSAVGLSLDTEKARAALAQCREGAQCRVPLDLTQPELSTEELDRTIFREVLGQATTRCSGTQDRISNVRVAAGYMNDVILMPGDVFSYLGTCGPYDTEKGYLPGLAYHGGKSVLSVGGGVCQGSSTLYYAVLRANLEVVERYAHGYEPSYIPGGMDATVASTVLDFKFRNNTEYPIRIEAYMDEKNDISIILHGTNTTGIHGEPYSLGRTVFHYAETVYEPKDSIPQGTQKKDPERTAYNGVTVEAWQKLVDAEGNVVEEYKLYTDRYAYRNAVVFYNPADADLWNIDPATGRIREPEPEETAEPEPSETAQPPEGTSPEEPPQWTPPPEPEPSAEPVAEPVAEPEGEQDPMLPGEGPVFQPPGFPDPGESPAPEGETDPLFPGEPAE